MGRLQQRSSHTTEANAKRTSEWTNKRTLRCGSCHWIICPFPARRALCFESFGWNSERAWECVCVRVVYLYMSRGMWVWFYVIYANMRDEGGLGVVCVKWTKMWGMSASETTTKGEHEIHNLTPSYYYALPNVGHNEIYHSITRYAK